MKFLPAKDGHLLGFLKSVTDGDGRVIQISDGNPDDWTRKETVIDLSTK